jgi:hypothetical protein
MQSAPSVVFLKVAAYCRAWHRLWRLQWWGAAPLFDAIARAIRADAAAFALVVDAKD